MIDKKIHKGPATLIYVYHSGSTRSPEHDPTTKTPLSPAAVQFKIRNDTAL
jgi:hypothetical protein